MVKKIDKKTTRQFLDDKLVDTNVIKHKDNKRI